MPVALTYPGVYVEEISSGVHTIIGVATSVTAFIGRAPRGAANAATVINSFADYERQFGGLSLTSSMSFAVRDFFVNGGQQAVIVRLFNPSFGNPEDQASAEAGAKEIADAAAATSTGKAAKAAADALYATISVPAKNTPAAELAGAKVALGVIHQQLAADDATQAQVTSAAATAGIKFSARSAVQMQQLQADSTLKNVGILKFVASSPGTWGGNLRIVIDQKNARDDVAQALLGPMSTKSDLINVTVTDTGTSRSESF